MAIRRIPMFLSSILVVICLVSILIKGFNFGIDFSSGYIVQLKFDKQISIVNIENKFSESNIEDVTVQLYGSSKDVLIKLKDEEIFKKNNKNNFLNDTFSDESFTISKLEYVGAQVGSELREKGEWAMLIALFSILIYVALRFELIYGLGAITALIHDVIITLGVFYMSIPPQERVAVISTKHGDMVVEFYPDVAPMHVESFISLAEEEYFNGTTFHRVIPGFVIQGGDPNSKLDNRALHGTGGRAGKFFGLGDENDPNSWLIPAEFNDIPHTKGILSMARTNDPNSASSQFFVCHDNAPFLDKNYTVFGKVFEGQEVIELIVNSEKDMNDNPLEKIEMTVVMKDKSEVFND